jgi:hypothetical protein
MAFFHTERWYFSTPLDDAKAFLTGELGLPGEFSEDNDDEQVLVIKAEDRAALNVVFSKLGINEADIKDDDGNHITLSEFEFVFAFIKDHDGPFEWILEICFSEEEMAFFEWPYLWAAADAIARKLGGKHEGDRTGEEIIAEGHLWAPPPPVKLVRCS